MAGATKQIHPRGPGFIRTFMSLWRCNGTMLGCSLVGGEITTPIAHQQPSRTCLRLTLGAWLLYLSVLAPSLATWDGGGMLNVSVSLIQKHDITVDPTFGQMGRGGKFYGMWYPLLSLVAIPFAAVGLAVAHHVQLPATYVVAVFAVILSTIIAALNVGATYYLGRARLGASETRAIASAVFFGFGTLALRYSRSFYADPLLTLLTTGVLIAMFSQEPSYTVLAILSCLIILAKPVGVLVAAVAFLYLVIDGKRRAAFFVALGSIAGSALYAFYDWIRFENVFKSGQPDFWSLREIPFGLPGLLVSPGVGLLVCCPVVFLAFHKRLNHEVKWIVSIGAAYLLLYSCWQRWYASDWGPRFLMPIMPALIVASALTRYRRTWLVLAAAGLLMQIPTVFGSPERYEAVLSAEKVSQETATWHPWLSSTVGMWRSAIDQVRDARHEDIHEFAVYRPNATKLADARNFRIVPLWWWMLPLVRIPRAVGLSVALVVALAGVLIIWRTLSQGMVPPFGCYGCTTSNVEKNSNRRSSR
jgi:hypothetical protein